MEVDNEPTVSDMVAKVSELKRDFIGICELEITYSQHCKSAEVVDTFDLKNGKPHEWQLISNWVALQTWCFAHGVCIPVQASCLARGVALGHEDRNRGPAE